MRYKIVYHTGRGKNRGCLIGLRLMNAPVFVFREVDRARFDEVQSGIKSVETRAGGAKYQNVKVGDEITFVCGGDRFTKKVVKRYDWLSIEAMLAEVPLTRVMPDLTTPAQATERYYSYPEYKQKIAAFGLVGFELV